MIWIVLIVVVSLIVFFRWFERAQIYHPSTQMAPPPPSMKHEEVVFPSGDGQVHGWFFRANETNNNAVPFTVLFCHGNAGNISDRLDYVQIFIDLGLNILLFDYRGYGQSKGRVTEAFSYQDAEAAHDWLVNVKEIPAHKIILYGESLGGGVVSELALRKKCGGMILQSTFASIPAIGKELFPFLPVDLVSTIRYSTIDKLPKISIPVLVMHSKSDRLIGFHHATKNFEAAREPKLLWEISGDHNESISADPEKFIEGLKTFFKSLGFQP
jgi:fermentation-respiration switch protein FrsA (DUF1100 family)